MTKRIQKGAAALLALGALGFGGSAVAGAASTAEPVGGPDHDTIQSGDQTTPDVGTKAATASKSSTKTAAPSEQPGVESSTEAPGTESSSETAPGNDGPGGHADEPGNPQEDNQFQGQQ
jgi:hypothetical protein